MNDMKIHSQYILGVRVDFGLTMSNVIKRIEDLLQDRNNTHLICTTNAEFISDAQEDIEFKNIINNSSLSIPDGIGILFSKYYLDNTAHLNNPLFKFVWGSVFGLAAFFRNFNTGEKISGVELSTEIMKLSDKKGYSVFLLGGWPKDFYGNQIVPAPFDLATVAAAEVKRMYPNVNIIGATSSFRRDPKDDDATVEYIKECMKLHKIDKLDILLIAYNHKYQEKWYLRNASKIPAVVGLGIGGTLDYLSGYLQRPSSYKFEWLKKLFFRPSKLSRILKVFPLYPLKVFFDSIRK